MYYEQKQTNKQRLKQSTHTNQTCPSHVCGTKSPTQVSQTPLLLMDRQTEFVSFVPPPPLSLFLSSCKCKYLGIMFGITHPMNLIPCVC
jgi:hypothetical protein